VVAVADTNVAVYFLLGTPGFAEEAEAFWVAVKHAHAPSHWEAECANVIWLSCRQRTLDPDRAIEKLVLAQRLPIRRCPIRTLWRGAVERSLATGVAVYDTLFVELAAQRGCPLATFDQQVLHAFPALACRPRDLV